MEENNESLSFTPSEDYVVTPYLKGLVERCLGYLNAGIPIELRGVAGIGKTSLAIHIAKQLARPIILLYGNDEFASGDLMGNFHGVRKKWIIDNYISTVTKKEENLQLQWIDGRFVSACRNGYTLIYDEFTRAKPETNNILLSALSEGVIELPNVKRNEKYVKVHPNFRIIFTSNQQEYAGVFNEQDALKDRILTIEMNGMDAETEVAIVSSKSGLKKDDAEKIVKLFQSLAHYLRIPNIISVRKSIMLAKIVKSMKIPIDYYNPKFIEICKDVVMSTFLKNNSNTSEMNEKRTTIERYFELMRKGVR